MKKALLSLFILTLVFDLYAQDFQVKAYDPPIPYITGNQRGADILVSNTEPLGKHSAVYRSSNNTVYVSLPDTTTQSGSAIVILSSSNDGANWSVTATLGPPSIIPKTKMIVTSLDSVYCFLMSGSTVYCWNVLNNGLRQVRSTNYRDFDVAASSTGSMYIFFDTLFTNSLWRYSSSDGGITWGLRGNITSAGAFPRVYFSGLGDTLILNYYGPVLADTATSIIRSARYRETATATLATVGAFIDVARANEPKAQFSTVKYGSYVWFFYTADNGSDIDMKCKISVNGGAAFTDSLIIAPRPFRNDFWFDAKHNTRDPAGVDLIYYSDSAQVGLPTNISDKLYFTQASIDAPNSFDEPTQFSENPPVSSPAGYFPSLIEYYNVVGEAGVIWVGEETVLEAGKKVFKDKLVKKLDLTINFEACPETDTISVQVRNSTSPYSIVETKEKLGGQGISRKFSFVNIKNATNYYLVIKHRNSIETWSKSGGAVFTASALSYDFTTAASQAFGNNQILVGSEYSIYTGDVNQDETVDLTDIVNIFNDATLFVSGYVVTDLNCDDFVDLSDIVYAFNNSSLFVSVIRP